VIAEFPEIHDCPVRIRCTNIGFIVRFGKNIYPEDTRMHFEHRRQAPLDSQQFRQRVYWHLTVATLYLLASLALGTVGSHYTEGTDWLDGLLNSAMLLGGMGPTTIPTSVAGKWFSTFFALYAGLVFVGTSVWMVAPIFHRILHKFHADDQD